MEDRIQTWGTAASDFRIGDRVDNGFSAGTVVGVDEELKEVTVEWDPEITTTIPEDIRLELD